ncbi:hypothetical protein DYB30_000437 [Aphanomyces astaci]|uniref:Uncharacterized protein n=1 Tax=Aphanomyces astaci TaxID=112090 RepID=A0A397DZX5_APHAT|nr:hypothetical protein DYB30_000437 [Aphanomyces astaci]RHY73770.1 hypothetical protein DYB38_003190 [Aphanomyces astaci]
MIDDVDDDSLEKELKESAIFSPQVDELHLQAHDFSHFDGPALSLWHLRQLLLAPRGSSRTAATTSTMSPSTLHTLATQFMHSMSVEEEVDMVHVSFVPEPDSTSTALPTTTSVGPSPSDLADFRLHIAPQSNLYLSYRKYRVAVCLDASPSTLSIDPISGTLILDMAFQAIDLLLQGLVEPPPSSTSAFVFPEIYLSVIVQGAMVDSLCVLVQGVTLHAANVREVLALVKHRLQLLEDDWAKKLPSPSFSDPTSLATSLQNSIFALNSLPHDASPMLFLVTDGVVDLPNMYAYDDLMMQLARHNIQCHAIQISGGYQPQCAFGYVPDTDLLRFLADATGGSLFDVPTLHLLVQSRSHPLCANGLQPVLFFNPSLVVPRAHSWDMPQVVDAEPLAALNAFRPLRLFREKIHEYKMRGSVLKIVQARLQEGFFVSKVTVDSVVSCLLQWKSDIWLEYTVTANFMSNDMTLRVDVLAPAKFLDEFATKQRNGGGLVFDGGPPGSSSTAGANASTLGFAAAPPPSTAVSSMLDRSNASTNSVISSPTTKALHTFLKDLHERDRILLHLMSAIQMQATLDTETKPILNLFSRTATAVTSAHPVFTLLGDLSPLLWHRWFHVERFELIHVEWTAQHSADTAFVAADALHKWATMQLSPNNYLKFLADDMRRSLSKPSVSSPALAGHTSAKSTVNRKQRGSLISLAAAAATTAPAQKKAVCFVRLERSSTSAIVVVHVAFYAAKTAIRKAVLADLKRLLHSSATNSPGEPRSPGLVVSHRLIQRLLLEPPALTWLIAPEQPVAAFTHPPSCCGGSGVSMPVFAASMWHVVWLWHIPPPHQVEAMRRLQLNRQRQGGLVTLQATPTFVLLAQEVVVWNSGRPTPALYQCAISVVSETTVMTSFWMEPVTGYIDATSSCLTENSRHQPPAMFGTPPPALTASPSTKHDTAATRLSDTQWFEQMQQQLYQADLHVLSCLLTFHRIVQAAKDGVRVVQPPDDVVLPCPLNGFPVRNSPFSAARLMTTTPPSTERFLLYMANDNTANQHLHAMLVDSFVRLADCEVAWTEFNPPPHTACGPLWISRSSATSKSDTPAAPPPPGRCFAKVVGDNTLLLAFVPTLDTMVAHASSCTLSSSEGGASPSVRLGSDEETERLKWLAGLSSSTVVGPPTEHMARQDLVWFDQRRHWMANDPKSENEDSSPPFDVLPIQFYECSLPFKSQPVVTAQSTPDLDAFVGQVRAAHKHNFSHGVYHALRSGATIEPCDLLQALWSCVHVPLDVDVTRLHAMLPLESPCSSSASEDDTSSSDEEEIGRGRRGGNLVVPSASLNEALSALISASLTSIPHTQWYYYTGTAAADNNDDDDDEGHQDAPEEDVAAAATDGNESSHRNHATFFVRFECWQDEDASWMSEATSGGRPRSKSVRVLSASNHLTDVLNNMAQPYRLVSDDHPTTSLIDRVLFLSNLLKDPRHPRVYLRLVVMTLAPEHDAANQQQTKVPIVLRRLRNAIQELCAQHVLAILQCLPPRSLESPPLGALVRLLFDELPTASVRQVEYPLAFLPLELPDWPTLHLFHDHLLSNNPWLRLVRCDQVYFVIEGDVEPILYWAYFTVVAGGDSVSLQLHIPTSRGMSTGLDELGLLTRLHLGIAATVTQVNQFLLLQQMHETRSCSPLLLPSPHNTSSSSSIMLASARSSSHNNLFDMATGAPSSTSVSSSPFFWPGQFECPLKFQTTFVLKSRLVPHLALNMLCSSALEQFQVHNRHHLFVYRDKRGHVFYMTLVDKSQGSSSAAIELQVFGIREPSDEITVELCRVLEQKLDDTLLRILMKAMPTMKAAPRTVAGAPGSSSSLSSSSRQNKLTTSDFDFLVPDIAVPTFTTTQAIPPVDGLLFLHFVKEKLVETPYIRLAPPVDPADEAKGADPLLSGIAPSSAPSSASSGTAALGDEEPTTLSFVFNVNPELSGRSGFVASLGKGLAWVTLEVVDDTPSTTDSSIIMAPPVLLCALYEYAIESMLSRQTTPQTSYHYSVETVRELRKLMDKAGHLSATTITLMQQRDIVPSYDIEHVVKQLAVPFERLPGNVQYVSIYLHGNDVEGMCACCYRPHVFFRADSDVPYEPYDGGDSSSGVGEDATASYSFTHAFTFVCPMGAGSAFTFDEPDRLSKSFSASSLQSVDTLNSPMMISPRQSHPKDDTMLHSTVLSRSRHLFYQVELTHKGLVFASYNCHPHVLDILSTGFAKALGWCSLRQTLLRSILFQKRGYALASPTTCSMLQPSAMVVRPPSVLGKAPAWTGRDFTSTLIAFTPQVFHVLLDHNNPPALVTATMVRAVDGMGLVEYLRETGTPIEDIPAMRPRGTSSTVSEKLDTNNPVTPIPAPVPLPRTGVANPPPTATATSVRKANVPPNATNALMAARARARGVVKAAPVASTAAATTTDDAETKLPPAWTLTLNKDMLAPRSSLSKAANHVPTTTAKQPSTTALTAPPKASLPPIRRLSTSEKATSTCNEHLWRHTLRTLLPSSFSHYNQNERNELLKATDPLSYHGAKLRSALDFHDQHRMQYNQVYDLFKSLMAQECLTGRPIPSYAVDQLVGCGRLMLHRHFVVSFSGVWPSTASTVAHHVSGMLTLLSYEIQFIFNDVYAAVGRLHVDFLCHGGTAPQSTPATTSASSSPVQTLIHQVATDRPHLQIAHTAAFRQVLVKHLEKAGFRALPSQPPPCLVYVKKVTEGLVLVEVLDKGNGMTVRAYFVSERDVVSLDAGRHLPQSSYVQLTGDQVVYTMAYVQTLLQLKPMVYDFAVADLHAYLLKTLATTKDQLKAHLVTPRDLRHVTSGMEMLVAMHPSPPTGANHCITAFEVDVNLAEDVSLLVRYIACHAKRYYVSDLLVFGTPNAIAARSVTGHFLRNVNGNVECPYSLIFILELLDTAQVDYRRDVLWSQLLCSGKSLAVQAQMHLPPNWVVEVGPEQLEECLALSVRTPFVSIDPVLGELLKLPVPWHEFASLLEAVHKETMREYHFKDTRHVLLMCVGARDIMIHIQHDSTSHVQMEICRRDAPPNGMLSPEQRKTLRDFVNHIVYWLWTQLNS